MLCREIKDNAYNKHFTSVSLQWKESVQVGEFWPPMAPCPGLPGKPSCLQWGVMPISHAGLDWPRAQQWWGGGVLPSPEHSGSAMLKTTVNRWQQPDLELASYQLLSSRKSKGRSTNDFLFCWCCEWLHPPWQRAAGLLASNAGRGLSSWEGPEFILGARFSSSRSLPALLHSACFKGQLASEKWLGSLYFSLFTVVTSILWSGKHFSQHAAS